MLLAPRANIVVLLPIYRLREHWMRRNHIPLKLMPRHLAHVLLELLDSVRDDSLHFRRRLPAHLDGNAVRYLISL